MSLQQLMLSTASVSDSPEIVEELLDVLAQELLEQAQEGSSHGAVTEALVPEGLPRRAAPSCAAPSQQGAPDDAADVVLRVLEDCSLCSSGQGSPGGSVAIAIRPASQPAAARQDVADESAAVAGPAGGGAFGSTGSSEGGEGTTPLSPLTAPGAPTETTLVHRNIRLAASANPGSTGSSEERRGPRNELNCHQEFQLLGPPAPLWARPRRSAGGAPPLGAGRLEHLVAEAFREHARELASLREGHARLAEAHTAAEESRASVGRELLARVGEFETTVSKTVEGLRKASEADSARFAGSAAGLEKLEGRLAACERQAEEARGAQADLAAEAAALRQRADSLESLIGRVPARDAGPWTSLAKRVEGVEQRMSDLAEGHGAEFAATTLKLDRMQTNLACCETHLSTLSSTGEAHAQEVADLRSKLADFEDGRICSALAKLAEDTSRLGSEFTWVGVRAGELQKDNEARLRLDLDSLARQLGAMQKRLQGPEEAAVMCELGQIRSALSARESDASICELRCGQRSLAARLEAAEAGLAALRQSELREAPGGAAGDADRTQSRLRERVEALQGRLDALAETQGQATTALEGLRGWVSRELEGLRKPSGHQHTALAQRLDYLEEFLGYSAGRYAEQLASAHAKLGQMSGRLSAYEADRPNAEAREAAPQDTPPLGASLRHRIDLLENVVSTLSQGSPGSGMSHGRPEPPRSGSATTRRSPSPDGGADSVQTVTRSAWDEPMPCRLDQTRLPATTRHRSVPSSRGRGDHARFSGGGDSLGAAWHAPATAPSASAPRLRGYCAMTPEKAARGAAHRGSGPESLKFFEGLSGTPRKIPSTLDRVSVSYRPSSTPRSWLGRAPRPL